MTDQKARNEIRDMLGGAKIGEAWVRDSERAIKSTRELADHLQSHINILIKHVSMECLKDALRELSDHIDDGRAALDNLPDLIDEAWREREESA